MYADRMVDKGILSRDDIVRITGEQFEYFNKELLAAESYTPEKSYFDKQWQGFVQAPKDLTTWDTGITWDLLSHVGKASVYHPANFVIARPFSFPSHKRKSVQLLRLNLSLLFSIPQNVHPQVNKSFVNARLKRVVEGVAIDWATAEAMAIGSLMYQGFNVRLSGEDVGRGTFAQRHAMLVDQETNEVFIPLNAMKGGLGGKYEIANSILSEEAVLGFEYGMSIDNPQNLVSFLLSKGGTAGAQ